LSHVKYQAGEEVAVGDLVALLLKPGEKPPKPLPSAIPFRPETSVAAAKQEVHVSSSAMHPHVKLKASPLAKHIARKQGIDLSLVRGSGPGGRILKGDILKYEEEKAKRSEENAPLISEKPLSSMRETIARRMTESFQSVPHFYISVEADAEELNAVREKLKTSLEKISGWKLTITDLLVKILARTLEEQPEVNVQWTGKGIRQLSDIHIGLAIGVKEGLVVPVIRKANMKALAELAKIRSDFVQRAREGKLRMEEMRGGSITLTNLGMYGIDQFDPIVNPPESCILGTGRILEKPVAYQGQIVIRKRMNLTLAIDHRVLDGVLGSRFLQRVKELIEEPVQLI
jgi:pyruvate dehydrogenase E2 component (dihydrolipoamide acetyltransferase)